MTIYMQDNWRSTHLGRRLGEALRLFDGRVLELMAQDAEVPLALSNLAARHKVSAAHIHITRHLPLQGARLTELAQAAGMRKQAMANLVEQCMAWGMVQRVPDPRDRRASLIVFTPLGLDWLRGFERAIARAMEEFKQVVGEEVATVILLGLEVYAPGGGIRY